MNLKEQFEAAVINSKSIAQKPDNNTLLKLYSLYKQSTVGDVTGEAPDNIFDMVGKAKFNAWSTLKGTSSETAMQEYINLVNQLKG